MTRSAARASARLDLLQGTLDLLILRAVRSGSNEVLRVETGSLYPALHRLEKKGLIKAEWKLTEFNQRAKYYRLTVAGQKQLDAERARWQQFAQAIASLLDAPEPAR
jgi:PadR family transcriptional regulator, regulatory protein PadR